MVSHNNSHHPWPHQVKKCLRTCACADSHHPAHAQSTIRAFTLYSYFLWYAMILLADSESPSQTMMIIRVDLGLRSVYEQYVFTRHDPPYKSHFSDFPSIALLYNQLYHNNHLSTAVTVIPFQGGCC